MMRISVTGQVDSVPKSENALGWEESKSVWRLEARRVMVAKNELS